MNSDIITPEHPRWDEFVEKLQGPGYCNFQEQKPGDPRSITWRCKGGTDKSFARDILEKMGGFDVDASLEYFEQHGGYCDCEILFNVDPGDGDEGDDDEDEAS